MAMRTHTVRRWRSGRLAAALLTATSLATTAAAQASLPDTPEAFGDTLRAWGREHGSEKGFVVVRRGGRIVHRSAFGGANPRAPVHTASLSKAITAACIATLVRDRKLGFDTPVSAALARFMAGTGGFGDRRLAQVTVAQLLTHRAGYGTSKNDPGSGPELISYLHTHTARERPSRDFLAWAIKHRLAHDPGTKFVYSNTGYLALGALIEEVTGKGYAPYCREAVLAPLGLAGELDPNWRVMWSYGGWRMTADDYLAFLDLFDATDLRLGTVAKTWMLDPAGKETGTGAAEQGAAWYGLGMYVRKAAQGVSVRHFGSWVYNARGHDGLLKTNFLTFAARQGDGTSWMFHVSPRPPRDDEENPVAELTQGLLAAYRATKKWPP
jgi:CubicO group peptidase (beta-lactamase class C family)